MATKTNNYIELNGKRYDATTGELLAHVPASAHKVTATAHLTAQIAKHATQGKTVDGFRNVSATVTKSPITVSKPSSKPPVMDIRRSASSHIAHHKPERSKTLMRKVVTKPSPSVKRSLKPQTRTDILAKVPAHDLVPKLSINHIDEKRLKRAEQVNTSKLVSRFGQVSWAESSHPSGHVRNDTSTIPNYRDIKPVYTTSIPVSAPSTPVQPSLDIFEQALARANGHKETYISPKKSLRHTVKQHRGIGKKLLRTSAASLAVLLVAGFIAYQNTANIQMRLASSRAGFSATLPGFHPDGYAIGRFTYGAGYVAVNYHSRDTNQSFNISQRLSNYNSGSLLSDYVATAAGSSYQTIQTAGRTIYTYGNNNATWVDRGIWYTIVSDGALNTTQLVDLATSM